MAYINPNILQEDWDALGTWADQDTADGVSSISPAGQLYLDDRALTGNGKAQRGKDLGTIGTGDYYIELRFKGDVWDGTGSVTDSGIQLTVSAGTNRAQIHIGNQMDGSNDGIWIVGSGGRIRIDTTTWDNNFHTIVFFIHNSQTDVDIWIDKDPSGAADYTDVDIDDAGGSDGEVFLSGRGTVAGDGEYHIDYTYIGTKLGSPSYINPDIFQIDWGNLTGWADNDSNGAVSEIDPAGQLHLDIRGASGDAIARRTKDLGTIGTGNYYVEIKFKGDNWDGYGARAHGFYFGIAAGTNELDVVIGNGMSAGDGIEIYDGISAWQYVHSETWTNDWHTIVFFVHNSQTDVDIWIDKSPWGAADVTDAVAEYSGSADGTTEVMGRGTVAGDGEYHIDYYYVGSERFPSSSSSSSLSSSSSSSSSLSSSSSSSLSSSSSSSFSSSSSSSSSLSSSSSSSFSSSSSSSLSSSSSSSSSSFSSSSSSSSSLSSSSSSFSFSSSSSSLSSSSSSVSSSSLSSSSSSSSAYPAAWGIAWGELDPDPGESKESWATWSNGAGGSPTILGDADWGRLFLGKDGIAHSPVHHFNALDSYTTLTKNKHGPDGVGSFKVYYRESDTPFLQDAGTPAWDLYTNPVRLTKAYRQVRLVGE